MKKSIHEMAWELHLAGQADVSMCYHYAQVFLDYRNELKAKAISSIPPLVWIEEANGKMSAMSCLSSVVFTITQHENCFVAKMGSDIVLRDSLESCKKLCEKKNKELYILNHSL